MKSWTITDATVFKPAYMHAYQCHMLMHSRIHTRSLDHVSVLHRFIRVTLHTNVSNHVVGKLLFRTQALWSPAGRLVTCSIEIRLNLCHFLCLNPRFPLLHVSDVDISLQ